MISSGNATVFVSNMDNAIRFYSEALGLKLTNRFGNHWAAVQAGQTLLIGLHPWSAEYPRPGTKGSVQYWDPEFDKEHEPQDAVGSTAE